MRTARLSARVDLPDEGEALSPEWAEMANNVCGTLHGHRNAALIAERFVRAGWRSNSSSWHGYEVGTSWCDIELDPVDGQEILLEESSPHTASTTSPTSSTASVSVHWSSTTRKEPCSKRSEHEADPCPWPSSPIEATKGERA